MASIDFHTLSRPHLCLSIEHQISIMNGHTETKHNSVIFLPVCFQQSKPNQQTAARGVLLVLDSHATPFQRIWCCFELSMAIESATSRCPLRLDIASVAAQSPELLTDGLTEGERRNEECVCAGAGGKDAWQRCEGISWTFRWFWEALSYLNVRSTSNGPVGRCW